jgi:hypothetical protein
MRRATAWTAVFMLASVGAARADFLATYDFTGQPGTQASQPVQSQPAGLTFSDITRGSDLTPEDGDDSINSRGWETATQNFYQFSVMATGGVPYALTDLDFTSRRNATGPTDITIEYSFDNFATPGVFLLSFFLGDTGNVRLSADLGDTFIHLLATTTFRIYGTGATSNLGTYRLGIDNSAPNSDLPANLVIAGRLEGVVVPEPGSMALAGSGMALLIGIAWKRRRIAA